MKCPFKNKARIAKDTSMPAKPKESVSDISKANQVLMDFGESKVHYDNSKSQIMQVSGIKEENKHEQIYIDKQEDEEDFSISIKQNESRSDISSPKNNNDLYANINRSQRPGFVNDENMGFSRNEQNWFAGNSSGLTG
eukprot:CAMPEP_0168332950 /NCGR_PEP_ID=MMETSP0213-20121227/9291_1 /TAXON_ID=151035 /ORGANISM="Euplotes harpa, Strain FSP1.4" /LENGTH=137 /DNA_ID=CAMNT_0008337129 /DNA_START=423 /DNA_END=833 /DNA_ORIENTATION=-